MAIGKRLDLWLQYSLAQLSQLREKSEQYQGQVPEGLHYRAGVVSRWGTFAAAVILGGGWGGRSSLRFWTRSF